jgi:hypothetical protein
MNLSPRGNDTNKSEETSTEGFGDSSASMVLVMTSGLLERKVRYQGC